MLFFTLASDQALTNLVTNMTLPQSYTATPLALAGSIAHSTNRVHERDDELLEGPPQAGWKLFHQGFVG